MLTYECKIIGHPLVFVTPNSLCALAVLLYVLGVGTWHQMSFTNCCACWCVLLLWKFGTLVPGTLVCNSVVYVQQAAVSGVIGCTTES